jgi:NAD(P)-dependent dehydrogenase (short-subunit alcohol dehydrogenase family)
MSNGSRVWLITGISRGLGRELARVVMQEGDVVVGTTRSGESDLEQESDALYVLPLELPGGSHTNAVVRVAHAIHGRLDVVVNNVGYGLLGAVEEATEQEAHRVFDVNFWGTFEVVRAVLPLLRAQRSGHIVNLSSIAGLAPMAGSGLYAAAKFAVEGMSLALAEEVAPLGLRVTLVEPGAFRTDFLTPQSIRSAGRRIQDYAETSGRVQERLAALDGNQPGDPVAAARAIVAAVRSEQPPLHFVLGPDAMARTRARLDALTKDLARWEPQSLSTDFAPASSTAALKARGRTAPAA